MGCGRERQSAGPAVADGAPPLPAQPPAPPGASASPVGALLSRTAKGDWGAALKVAAGPTALLLVLASVAAMFFADTAHSGGLGWGVRMRIALALLLQGVGGGVSLSGNASASLEAFGEGFAGEVTLSLVPLLVTAAWAGVLACAARRFLAVRPGSPAQPGPAAAAGVTGVTGAGAGTAVLEAVLRVAVLCGAGAFVLGLLAQPSYDGVTLSSAPFLTLLWSLLLAAAVCGAAVGRGGAGSRLAARPGWRAAVGALRTALLALLVVVTLAGAVTVAAVLATEKQDLDGGAVVAMLVLLPNIGALALATAWGAPVTAEWNLPGVPFLSTSSGRESLGYGELGHLGGGWVLFGVIVGGAVGALLVGFLAVRRSAERREQLLAAGFFVVSLMLLVPAAGASVTAVFRDGGSDGGYGSGSGDAYGSGFGGGYGGAYGGHVVGAHGELAANGAETLLFALLWTFGAVLVVPYLLRRVGRGGGPATAAVPPAPYAAPAAPPATAYDTLPGAYDTPPAAYDTPVAPPVPATPTAPDLPALAPDVTPLAPTPVHPLPLSEEPARPPRRVLKWVAIGLAAFLVGGGATAGALYVKDHGGSDRRADRADKPSGATTGAPRPGPSVEASPTATASGNPTGAPTGNPTGSPVGDPSGAPTAGPDAALPAGFVQKYDPNGFSLAVRRDWERSPKGTQTDYRAPVGEQYLRIGVIANTPQSSYENFLSMEKGAEKRVDYQRVEMRKNTFQNRPAARWEFTYVNDAGDTVHAVDQAYVAADGTEYSIYYECPEALYDPAGDKIFSTALATWSVSATDVD
ncbi:PT domain-containing protein [Streptomyces lydicus]|uniref:PT domain-containing protein n=1 Tax=Streptomyces lydicus TaxID=47763 RepID=UPI0037D6B0C2